MIGRQIESILLQYLKPNKVVVLLGARRIGKTTLIKKIERTFERNTLYLNAEDTLSKEILETKSISSYKRNFEGIDLLIIDEAQVIPEIGKILKLIVDELEGIKVLATGSSAFDLMNRFGEPLTGRSFTFHLYPFSQSELKEIENPIEMKQNLADKLVFGMYPELLEYKTANEKKTYLNNLVNTYLLKDILALEGLRGSSKIMDLLKLLAWQTGMEVSPHELGKNLNMSKNTVDKYLDLLQKVFVIFELKAFSKNLRKEVSKNRKWYFVDTGVRNAIISDFSPVETRKDVGQLWENFIISERLKKHNNQLSGTHLHFWRTYDQQEIDLVEETDGNLNGFEIKWQKTKGKIPIAWKNTYPEAGFSILTKSDYPENIE
ncbi:MAG TPA: ATP-binding protein [Bacteroidales bacterium]|nr:ATP-binding protein [Bacteroidales bacterium]HPE55330.1 ATP-binding protein [Bacteroidales bacterium]HRX95937.1 ATP-binding protein [Bacteroidales bacterium]